MDMMSTSPKRLTLEGYVGKVRGYLDAQSSQLSRDQTQELCKIADVSGSGVQYLFHQILSGGAGFVVRSSDRVLCFNFSSQKKLLACDAKKAEKQVEVKPTPIRLEEGDSVPCLQKMQTWSFLRKDLKPEKAIQLVENNLSVVSLVENLLPKVLPLKDPPEKNIERAYQLLKTILVNPEIDLDMKRHYGRFIQAIMSNYFGGQKQSDIYRNVMHQSAFNQMFNDFSVLTRDGTMTFSTELSNFSGGKVLGASFIGMLTYFGSYPFFKEWIAKGGRSGLRSKAVSSAFFTSIAVSVVTYLLTSGVESVSAFFEEKKLEPCTPPFCPVVLTQPDKN